LLILLLLLKPVAGVEVGCTEEGGTETDENVGTEGTEGVCGKVGDDGNDVCDTVSELGE
jgi:hypothetical protein